MKYIKVMKIVKIIGLFMAGLMSWFSPINQIHNGELCCVGCHLKKEDEVELVEEHIDETGGN